MNQPGGSVSGGAPENLSGSFTGAVMVFAEQREGRFQPVAYELIGKGRELAGKIGAPVVAVVIGRGISREAAEILEFGVSTVLVYDSPEFESFVPEAYAEVLSDAVERVRPGVLLIGATPVGRSVAPRVAVRFRTGLTADCTVLDIRPNGELVQTRPAFGGNVMATIVTKTARPQMATVRPRVMTRAEKLGAACSGKLRAVSVPEEAPLLLEKVRRSLSRYRVISESPVPQAESIADARVTVAVGRGLRSRDDLPMFETLAARLGGILACSRPLVEKGWFPASRQVGLSGRTVRPRLYLAFGISGAVQHVAGMSGSEVIIAVNVDRQAPIFGVAHYAVVADMYEVVPELLERLDGGKEVRNEG